MNKKTPLIILSLFILLSLQLNAFAVDYIISGSGYNYPETDEVGSMGVYVPTSSLDGWLRYYYPGMNLISTSITGASVQGDEITITGEGTVEGNPDYAFAVTIMDMDPDEIEIEIYNPDSSLLFHGNHKPIVRGNFNIAIP